MVEDALNEKNLPELLEVLRQQVLHCFSFVFNWPFWIQMSFDITCYRYFQIVCILVSLSLQLVFQLLSNLSDLLYVSVKVKELIVPFLPWAKYLQFLTFLAVQARSGTSHIYGRLSVWSISLCVCLFLCFFSLMLFFNSILFVLSIDFSQWSVIAEQSMLRKFKTFSKHCTFTSILECWWSLATFDLWTLRHYYSPLSFLIYWPL